MIRKRWIRTAKLLAALFTFVPLISGCWDRLEIEERAVVLGVAVDKADARASQKEDEVTHPENVDPAPDQEEFRVSVQIALPGRIPLGPGESGGGKENQTVWVIGVSGHTIDDAMMNLQQQISSRLFFGHLRVIVISEDVARRGLTNLNDYLRRNPEVRRMAWMMISHGKAENVIRARPPLERVPTMYLISTLDNAVRMGKFPQAFAGMFWSNSSKLGQEGFLPYVKIMNEENVELAGLAVFKNDRLVGTTEPLEISVYMGIKHLNPGGYRAAIPVDGTTVTIYGTHRNSKIRVRIRDGLPEFTVNIQVEVNVEEKTNEKISLSTEKILNQIEKTDSQFSKGLHEETVAKTQRWGADIFGFGEYVRAKKSKFWNQNVKTKEKWQEMYKNVPVHINVVLKIRRVGMKAR